MDNTTAMTIIDYAPPAAVSVRRNGNYDLTICGRTLELQREVHFGKIPGTKTPSLYKAGAEKIVWTYGITTKYYLEKEIEDYENGFFMYRFRCELWKGDTLITMGYGSSNSKERKNGSASGFDVANSCLKIAKKRALVDGAILVGQLSDMFTQDMENEVYTGAASALFGAKDPNAKITAEQVTYFYTIATRNGYTKEQAKAFLKSHGFASAKDITSGKFDSLCEEMRAVEVDNAN